MSNKDVYKMNQASEPPESTNPKRPKPGLAARVAADPDLIRGLRFLKRLLINTGVTVTGFAIIGVGGYFVALVVHGILWALNAGSVELPFWIPRAEAWSVGIFLVLLMFLAVWLAGRDVWQIGVRSDSENETPDSDKKEPEG